VVKLNKESTSIYLHLQFTIYNSTWRRKFIIRFVNLLFDLQFIIRFVIFVRFFPIVGLQCIPSKKVIQIMCFYCTDIKFDPCHKYLILNWIYDTSWYNVYIVFKKSFKIFGITTYIINIYIKSHVKPNEYLV
jgi:hypothetical protein